MTKNPRNHSGMILLFRAAKRAEAWTRHNQRELSTFYHSMERARNPAMREAYARMFETTLQSFFFEKEPNAPLK